MFPPQSSSLYSISLQRTFDLLKTGVWNTVEPNPFSFLPSRIINELMKLAVALPFAGRPKITELLILITSGRLSELELTYHDIDLHPNIFLNIISRDTCKNLRSFSIPSFLRDADNPPIEDVLRCCSNLENIHSASPFDLESLKDSIRLRSLRFHLTLDELMGNFQNKTGVYSQILKSLERFSICISGDSFLSSEFVARVLLSFPKLYSIGLVDSSLPIKLIQRTKRNPSLYFQLKRCFWGLSKYSLHTEEKKLATYRKEFPKIIKLAAFSCPHTEVLSINVFHNGSLQYLYQLKRLTFLNINFKYCNRDYIDSWFSVLTLIGPQLKHLSIEGSSNFSLDLICDNCPNLESLSVNAKAVVTETPKNLNVIPLKRLDLLCMDEKSLLYILSNCLHLEEIFLDCALCLDDNLLGYILKHNPLSELRIAGIYACKLSKLGLRMLLKSAAKLEKISFRSVKFNPFGVVRELNRKIANYEVYMNLKDEEFFSRQLHPCYF